MNLYSYRYRLYPTQDQEILLAKHFGSTRYVYNHFLSQRKNKYLASKKSSNYFQDCKELTELKKTLPWIKEIGSQSLQYSLKCLEAAYNNFFAGRNRFPTFKAKYHKQSFRVPQNTKIDDDKLYIPKFLEGIRMIQHRPLEGTIKFSTISKNKSGQYHVSITVEREIPQLPKTDKEVGIDFGIKTLATCSDGTTYENIKSYRIFKKRMKRYQRQYNKKKGSKNKERARKKLAKIHQKIVNIRRDHLHKTTRKIINENQVIYLETLAVQNMMKNHKLAGAIADVSWSEMNRQLEYKAAWAGREIIRLDRWFPSSKTHELCGWINQNLKLKDRTWVCQCGEVVDRDLNAAKMILKQGKIEKYVPLERRELKRMDLEEIRLNIQSTKEEIRNLAPLGA